MRRRRWPVSSHLLCGGWILFLSPIFDSIRFNIKCHIHEPSRKDFWSCSHDPRCCDLPKEASAMLHQLRVLSLTTLSVTLMIGRARDRQSNRYPNLAPRWKFYAFTVQTCWWIWIPARGSLPRGVGRTWGHLWCGSPESLTFGKFLKMLGSVSICTMSPVSR